MWDKDESCLGKSPLSMDWTYFTAESFKMRALRLAAPLQGGWAYVGDAERRGLTPFCSGLALRHRRL
jgi:hypothetical protein